MHIAVPRRELEKRDSKWRARIASLKITLGYFESKDETARAHDNYIQRQNLNLMLNANASGTRARRS